MKFKIINTSDKSDTIFNSKYNESYHSTYGARSESTHVFIETGLNYCQLKSIKIFEVGFGTGLNTILTYIESIKRNLKVEYTAIELFPVDLEIINQLNYTEFLSVDQKDVYSKLHTCKWNENVKISESFTFQKTNSNFNNYIFSNKYDIIYFDAFAPDKQPEMWSTKNFAKIYEALNKQGILTTYSSKGIVKNNLRSAGFKVSRLPGPIGKRHILRAEKL